MQFCKLNGSLRCLAQELAITVVDIEISVDAVFAVLAELFYSQLRNVAYDASGKMQFAIPTSKRSVSS